MRLSQEALVSGHYETAYHTLAAAMHYAQDRGDEKCLMAVKQAAQAQKDWIDAHAPAHRMATQSAVQRQGHNLYDTLVLQAATRMQIAQTEHRLKHISDLQ